MLRVSCVCVCCVCVCVLRWLLCYFTAESWRRRTPPVIPWRLWHALPYEQNTNTPQNTQHTTNLILPVRERRNRERGREVDSPLVHHPNLPPLLQFRSCASVVSGPMPWRHGSTLRRRERTCSNLRWTPPTCKSSRVWTTRKRRRGKNARNSSCSSLWHSSSSLMSPTPSGPLLVKFRIYDQQHYKIFS